MADKLPSSKVICRDLWAMHLDTLKDPPPPEPLNEANMDKSDNEASDDEDEYSKPKSSSRLRSRTEDRGGSEEFDEDDGIYDELNLDEEEEKFGLAVDDNESDDSEDASEGKHS